MTDAEVKEHIQKKIIFLLNSNNTSMRRLSIQLGLSDSYLNQVLNNNMMPSLHTINNICQFYDLSLSEFFDAKEEYPVEYYRVTKELKNLSASRLQALYVLLHEETSSPAFGFKERI